MNACLKLEDAAQNSSSLTPKLRLEVQFKHGLNQDHDVMAQHLAECFIDLRRLGFASEAIAKLCLDHHERGFDVAAFVVVLHEPLLVVAIEKEHALKERAREKLLPVLEV